MRIRIIRIVVALAIGVVSIGGFRAFRLGQMIREWQDWSKNLTTFATAYNRFYGQVRRPPQSFAELEGGKPGIRDRVRLALERRGYVCIFGVTYDEMPGGISGGLSKFILAFPEDAKANGGLVLTADGALHQISAAEFNQRFPSQMQGVAAWPHRLAAIDDSQLLEPFDQVLIPRIKRARGGPINSYWSTASVSAAWPDGSVQVTVEEDVIVGRFDRWELRWLKPKSSPGESDERNGISPAQAAHYQSVDALRRARLAKAAAATTWPKYELVELDPKVLLRPDDPLYAPFQSRMQKVNIVKHAGAQGTDRSEFWVQWAGDPAGEDAQAFIRQPYEIQRRVRKPFRAMRSSLTSFVRAYRQFEVSFRRSPESWSELETAVPASNYRPLEATARAAFAKHGFEPVMGVAEWEMLKVTAAGGEISDERRLAQFILAFPNSASEEGGLIMMANATLRDVSAEEFREKLAAQTKSLDSLRSTIRKKAFDNALSATTGLPLVELTSEQSLQPGDSVFVPRAGKMVPALVTESLPRGQVRVERDASHRVTFDRWELRTLVRAESGASYSAEQLEAQRQASLTASLTAYAAAYHAYFGKHNTAPKTWEDIRSASEVEGLETTLKESGYDVVFDVPWSEMVVGMENFMLAYPHDAETKGGVVVMANRMARKVSVVDFARLFRAQRRGVAAQRVSSRMLRNLSPQAQAEVDLLSAYFEAWSNFTDRSRRGPASWDELSSNELEHQFEAQGLAAVFGLSRGTNNRLPVILAYPKDAAEKGGFVARSDGAVKEMTADEFRVLFAEQASERADK